MKKKNQITVAIACFVVIGVISFILAIKAIAQYILNWSGF
jgi:hypothetical protein